MPPNVSFVMFKWYEKKYVSMIRKYHNNTPQINSRHREGAQWLSGKVLDSRPKGRGFEPHRRHCVVSLSKNINPSLVLVQPRKTRPFITERLLMGRKESNQTNKQTRHREEESQNIYSNKPSIRQ